jgi:hypothetical protein
MGTMNAVVHWLWQVVAGLALLAAGAYTVVPRINAHIAERTAAFEERRQFTRRIVGILGMCGRLQDDSMPEDEQIAARLKQERERWLGLLDQHTIWLADNLEWYALGWPKRGVRNLPSYSALSGLYAAGCRKVMLSNRTESEKVELLNQLSTHAHAIFCGRHRPWRVVAFVDEVTKLDRLLATLGADTRQFTAALRGGGAASE